VIPAEVRAAIQEARAAGAYVPLSDRSGYDVFLGDRTGVACPRCGTAMGICRVRQLIAGDGLVTVYGHVACAEAPAEP